MIGEGRRSHGSYLQRRHSGKKNILSDSAALAGHECRCTCGGFGFHCICGNYCPVCNYIICAAELIKALSLCAAMLCMTPAIHMAILQALAAESGPEAVYSLVSLKVKLSD